MAEFYDGVNEFCSTRAMSERQGHAGPHKGGAMLLAVCRGKVSEGINFKYDNARAVLLVGIPFPPLLDPKVKLKKEYNDAKQRALGPHPDLAVRVLGGGAWYKQQAFRAYNQALGRCIRNQRDYGAIVLIDARFSMGASPDAPRNRGMLSRWVRPRIQDFDRREAVHHLREFFADLNTDPTMGRLEIPTAVDSEDDPVATAYRMPGDLAYL
mmetsp:Transcript_36168/g.68073  ORF Transcript_36168/g.68073 Transcript_36168/m.68073 type:complete len:211 (+) Transcript_36168:58-690(+)